MNTLKVGVEKIQIGVSTEEKAQSWDRLLKLVEQCSEVTIQKMSGGPKYRIDASLIGEVDEETNTFDEEFQESRNDDLAVALKEIVANAILDEAPHDQ